MIIERIISNTQSVVYRLNTYSGKENQFLMTQIIFSVAKIFRSYVTSIQANLQFAFYREARQYWMVSDKIQILLY